MTTVNYSDPRNFLAFLSTAVPELSDEARRNGWATHFVQVGHRLKLTTPEQWYDFASFCSGMMQDLDFAGDFPPQRATVPLTPVPDPEW